MTIVNSSRLWYTNMTIIDSDSRIWYEQSLNHAVYLGAMAWLLHAIVFFRCAYAMGRNKEKGARKWLPFICTIFALATTSIFCNFKFNELAWIQHREYPGGPLAFFNEQQSTPLNVLAIATSIAAMFLCYVFLMYRYYSLWQCRWLTVVLAVQLVLYFLVSVGILVSLICKSEPWDGATLSFTVPAGSLVSFPFSFWCLSPLARILYLRRHPAPSVPNTPGKRWIGHLKESPTLLESAAPLGLLSFCLYEAHFLWDTGANSFLMIPLFLQVTCIFPELILTKMVQGDSSADASDVKNMVDLTSAA